MGKHLLAAMRERLDDKPVKRLPDGSVFYGEQRMTREEALRIGQRYLHSLGITAWQDAIVRPRPEEAPYVTLASRGELTGRVVGAMWWERSRGGEQIEEFVERRKQTSIGRYQATSVKLMMDGVLENFTGAMLEPYADGQGGTTDDRGLLQIDPDARVVSPLKVMEWNREAARFNQAYFGYQDYAVSGIKP